MILAVYVLFSAGNRRADLETSLVDLEREEGPLYWSKFFHFHVIFGGKPGQIKSWGLDLQS